MAQDEKDVQDTTPKDFHVTYAILGQHGHCPSCSTETKVQTLKEKIAQETGYDIFLEYKGQELQDSQTLGYYDIVNQHCVILAVEREEIDDPGDGPGDDATLSDNNEDLNGNNDREDLNDNKEDLNGVNNGFRVRYNISTHHYKTTRDEFSSKSTVGELKRHISDVENLDDGELMLYFRGTIMKNHESLGRYEMSAANNIVAIRIVGGGGGPGGVENKENEDALSFEAASAVKKHYYSKFQSFTEITINDIDNDATLSDNPHFVLTLDNLTDLNDNKEDLNGVNEINELKRLKNCINTGQSDPKLELICTKLARVHQVTKENVSITDIFCGTTNIAYVIWDYTTKKLKQIVKNLAKITEVMKKEFTKYAKMVLAPPCDFDLPDSTDGSYHIVKSYHVSCASDKPCDNFECAKKEHNLGGVVLYMKDGKTDWYCNKRHCKIGYIIVKTADTVKKEYPDAAGIVHGATYQSVFKEKPKNVVGSGFARQDGVWKFKSGVFNDCTESAWHNYKEFDSGKSREMNDIESKWVLKAVEQWYKTGKQNLFVDEPVVIFKDDN